MKKIFLILLFSVLVLSSCGPAMPSEGNDVVVIKTGTLTIKSGEEYLLSTPEGIVNMTSNKINLDNYLKKKITVTGQFSGSTLYVDKIKPLSPEDSSP